MLKLARTIRCLRRALRRKSWQTYPRPKTYHICTQRCQRLFTCLIRIPSKSSCITETTRKSLSAKLTIDRQKEISKWVYRITSKSCKWVQIPMFIWLVEETIIWLRGPCSKHAFSSITGRPSNSIVLPKLTWKFLVMAILLAALLIISSLSLVQERRWMVLLESAKSIMQHKTLGHHFHNWTKVVITTRAVNSTTSSFTSFAEFQIPHVGTCRLLKDSMSNNPFRIWQLNGRLLKWKMPLEITKQLLLDKDLVQLNTMVRLSWSWVASEASTSLRAWL